ncbi:hypothetical protein [Brochothrix thermosphacta]|uniref:hypothetical protein n=1 Tax=Brochothrix thermosphacta TaxID=2756 RepID=UPI0011470DFB|nr:hypothetical protein [Brochothrix thermosphacta]
MVEEDSVVFFDSVGLSVSVPGVRKTPIATNKNPTRAVIMNFLLGLWLKKRMTINKNPIAKRVRPINIRVTIIKIPPVITL